jgi:hypothetical protein
VTGNVVLLVRVVVRLAVVWWPVTASLVALTVREAWRAGRG